MTSLRLQVGDTTVYEGPAIVVPRVGDRMNHDGQTVPVEATEWDFAGAPDIVSVTLVLGDQPYSY